MINEDQARRPKATLHLLGLGRAWPAVGAVVLTANRQTPREKLPRAIRLNSRKVKSAGFFPSVLTTQALPTRIGGAWHEKYKDNIDAKYFMPERFNRP